MTDLLALFDAQHQASRAQPEVPLALRQDRLRRVSALLARDGAALCDAVQSDFGVRSPLLTEVADLLVLRNLLKDLQRNLRRWNRPVRVRTPLQLWPARGWIARQPLGVVGVISPWNYPLQLSLGPAATALAAGNRVLLKPSELTPHCAALLAASVARDFGPEEFAVLPGDADLAKRFAALPFDHLFFTGSTAVGRQVAQAAAANLVPTTLELGGKSPCIIDRSTDLDVAALRIAHGKLLNAGQTCIAPDYVLLPRGLEDAFAEAWQRAVTQLFPRIEGNPDYAAIVSERHWQRLEALLAAARADGARILRPADAGAASVSAARQFAPALVLGLGPQAALMQEEIFGPILPVLPCDSADEAIAFINARPRPLALYWFGQDKAARDRVLAGTVSGGVALNDTLLHVAHDRLPFGGVGASGWGAYHGETGFLRFSQQKPVLQQARWTPSRWLYPPYGQRARRMLDLLRRLG